MGLDLLLFVFGLLVFLFISSRHYFGVFCVLCRLFVMFVFVACVLFDWFLSIISCSLSSILLGLFSLLFCLFSFCLVFLFSLWIFFFILRPYFVFLIFSTVLVLMF